MIPSHSARPIRLVKTGDKGTYRDPKTGIHPIFTGYTTEGFLFNPTDGPRVGAPFTFFRTVRNGVLVPGIFSTSPVEAILTHGADNVETIVFETANSTYALTFLCPDAGEDTPL